MHFSSQLSKAKCPKNLVPNSITPQPHIIKFEPQLAGLKKNVRCKFTCPIITMCVVLASSVLFIICLLS